MVVWASMGSWPQVWNLSDYLQTQHEEVHFFGGEQNRLRGASFKTLMIQGSVNPICNSPHPTHFEIVPFLDFF